MRHFNKEHKNDCQLETKFGAEINFEKKEYYTFYSNSLQMTKRFLNENIFVNET